MAPARGTTRQEVFDYRALRLSVGLVAFALAPVLVVGALLFRELPEGGMAPPLPHLVQPSISAYYHSNMEGVFVGALWAIATFLFAYKGKTPKEAQASSLACVFALGVALFPTADPWTGAGALWVSAVHLASAAAFFGILAYFCLHLFHLRLQENGLTDKQRRRKRIYTTCGWVIVSCILAIAASRIWEWATGNGGIVRDSKLVLYLEWLALSAFAVSWLTAGKWAVVRFLVDEEEAFHLLSRNEPSAGS